MADLTATVVGDVLGPISDLPSGTPEINLTATAADTLLPITDSPSATLINMDTGAQRWVAPVSITPRVSGTIDPLYLAAHPVRHPDRYYEPRIKSYGTFTRAISCPVGFVKTGDGALTVLDPDNSVRQRIAAKTITGAAVEVRLGPEGGSLEGFLRPISRELGIVSQPADGELSFPFQDSVSAYLDQSIPNLINIENFPLLPDEYAGEFAPIIFGHVSVNSEIWFNGVYFETRPKQYQSTEGGAVRAIYVNKEANNHLYLVARHPCRWVEVWKKPADIDSFTLVSPASYVLLTATIPSGEVCQFIKITADPQNVEVRVNVDGMFFAQRYAFVGFYGYHEDGDGDNDYYTQIGLLVKDSSTGLLVKTPLSGTYHSGDIYFEDSDIPAGSTLYSIKVWEGADLHIYNTQIGYIDGAGNITYGPKQGIDTPRGHMNTEFILVPGEYIESISGLHGEHIDEMTITSNLVPVTYGGVGGTTQFFIPVDQLTGVNFADAILEMLTGYVGITQSLDKINLASFDETRAKVDTLFCSGAITGQITWGEAISRLQRSSNIDLFADKNDRLTVRYEKNDETPSINLSDLLRLHKGTVKQTLASPTFNQIPYSFSPNSTYERWSTRTCDNAPDQAAIGAIVPEEPLQMYFVRDPYTALQVATKRMEVLGLDRFRIEGEIPLVPTVDDLELANIVTIDHFGGFEAGGYNGASFKILELAMDIDNLKYLFKGIKLAGPMPT